MPLMVGIQMVSARIGRVTGEGLAANIGKMCPRWLTLALVALLVVANTINIAADLAAMGEAVKLLAGGPQPLYVLASVRSASPRRSAFSYERKVRVLKWLTLALFAYVAVVFTVAVPWQRAIAESVQPWAFLPPGTLGQGLRGDGRRRARHDHQPLPVLLAGVAGSRGQPAPARAHGAAPGTPRYAHEHLSPHQAGHRRRHGLLEPRRASASCVATAVTLHAHGITDIQTSAQAAEALRPVAGEFAFLLFASASSAPACSPCRCSPARRPTR